MAGTDTIRDALFGNPPTPGFKPSREGVLNAFAEVIGTLSTITGGVATYQTKAAMLAVVPAATDPKVAFVIADATSANNGVYKYPTGGPWALFPEFYNSISAVVQPYVDLARKWSSQASGAVDNANFPGLLSAYAYAVLAGHYANDNTNVDVPGGVVGDRGAKYWASLAAAAVAGVPASLAALATVIPFQINKTAALRQARSPQGFGYTVPTYNNDGTFTLPANSGGGFDIELTPVEIAARTAGKLITAFIPFKSGTLPTSVVVIQYDGTNTEVGTRPTVAITSNGASATFAVNAATVYIRVMMNSGTGTPLLIFGRAGLSVGATPATVVEDIVLLANAGMIRETANEAVSMALTNPVASGDAGVTYVNGVLTTTAAYPNSIGINFTAVGMTIGQTYTLRMLLTGVPTYFNATVNFTGGVNGYGGGKLLTDVFKVFALESDPNTVIAELCFVCPPPTSGQQVGTPQGIRIDAYTTSSSPAVPVIKAIRMFIGPVAAPDFIVPRAYRDYIAQQILNAGGGGGAGGTTTDNVLYALGDSISAPTGGVGMIYWVSYYLSSVPYVFDAVSGQTAVQVGMRGGAYFPSLRVSGKKILAAKVAVDIDNYDPSISTITGFSNSADGTDPLPGKLGGIPGTLRSVRDGGGAITKLQFLRDTAGSDVQLNLNTPFVPTRQETGRSQYNFIRVGNNNIGGTDGVAIANGALIPVIDARIARLTPNDKRYVILGTLQGAPSTTVFDSSIATINDINYTLYLKYGAFFHDDNYGMTTEEWAELGITPTSTDLDYGDAAIVGSLTAGSNVLTVNSVTSGTVRLNKTLAAGNGIPRNLVISGGSGSSFTLSANSTVTVSNVPITIIGALALSLRGDALHPGASTGHRILGQRAARRVRQLGWFA